MHAISFGSDNHSGAHPQILAAIQRANEGYWHAYGEEEYSIQVAQKVAALFGDTAFAEFTLTGTGANVLALQTVLKSWQSVICAETAHINVHEAGALQKFTQARLHPIPTPDGKLRPEMILPYLVGRGDQHYSQPRVISVSQSTEYGTVYSLAELKALADFAHAHGLLLHMDGARLANAIAALDTTPKAMTTEIGADIVSFGGTKNGLLFGEAVVFLTHQEKVVDFIFYRKQGMQLLSKLRYVTLQFEAYLDNQLWLENARAANRMAAYLSERLSTLDGVTVTQPARANALFAILPARIIPELIARYHFYIWDEQRSEVRLMCSWNTTRAQIDTFVQDVEHLLRRM